VIGFHESFVFVATTQFDDSVYCPPPAGVTKGAQMHRDRVVEFAALSLLVVLVAALYAVIVL
jgi:hypothetical protein